MKHPIIGEIEELEVEILRAMLAFFADRGLPFDVMAYLGQASISVNEVASEAMFFGAERFPIMPDNANLASISQFHASRPRGRNLDAAPKRRASGGK